MAQPRSIDTGMMAKVGMTICGWAISVLAATTPNTAMTSNIANTRNNENTSLARIPIVCSAMSAIELPRLRTDTISAR